MGSAVGRESRLFNSSLRDGVRSVIDTATPSDEMGGSNHIEATASWAKDIV